jgi:hypothetical protein
VAPEFRWEDFELGDQSELLIGNCFLPVRRRGGHLYVYFTHVFRVFAFSQFLESGRTNERSVDEIHRKIGKERLLLISLHKIDQEVCVIIGPKYVFTLDDIFALLPVMRSIVSTAPLAILILDP